MTTVSKNTSVFQQPKERSLVLWFDEVGITDIPLVGGKNASLGEMIAQLTHQGINVPTGFATTAYAYRYFISSAGLEEKLRQLFSDLDVENVKNLQERGRKARSLLLHTEFPRELQDAIATAYKTLCDRYNPDTDVAVTIECHCRRSSRCEFCRTARNLPQRHCCPRNSRRLSALLCLPIY